MEKDNDKIIIIFEKKELDILYKLVEVENNIGYYDFEKEVMKKLIDKIKCEVEIYSLI